MFFSSWALWEKMTFVLALAIVGVFVLGWAKLVWRNQFVKRQELVDEEKRLKIQQLRKSGHNIQSRTSHDIPFGIRAIQSGIQVDGIWISQSATPVPSVLKFGNLRSSSSTESAQGKSATETADSYAEMPHELGQASISGSLDMSAEHPAAEPSGLDDVSPRMAYKPRRSSQLRSGSYGQFDEETLSQLEGRTSAVKTRVVPRHHHGLLQRYTETGSSTAEHEHNYAALDDSDAPHSHTKWCQQDEQRQFLLHQDTTEAVVTASSNTHFKKPAREAIPPKGGSVAAYTSIPSESSDPFIGTTTSPPEQTRVYQSDDIKTSHNAPAAPRAESSQIRRPFIPGELHVNKTVRKVNSGFEVLPAGTFGAPAEFSRRGVELVNKADIADRRQSTKLQKRPRNSISSRQSSGAAGRP